MEYLGTDPNDADSDGDGRSDFSEVNRGDDPFNSSHTSEPRFNAFPHRRSSINKL